MLLAGGGVLVAAFVASQWTSRDVGRRLTIVAGVALGVRLLAVTIVHLNAIRTHGEGTWLNDEASFFLAAESLLPNPFDKALPQGLGHLGGNAYLGLTAWIAVALGHMDAVAFRLTNATLGTLAAVLASIVAAAVVGERAALITGVVVAIWPTLVLWSATFLRDTLGGFVVLAVWWTLVSRRDLRDPRVLAVVTLSLVLLTGLRPYLAGATALGVAAWAVAPWLVQWSRRALASGAVAIVVVGGVAALLQARQRNACARPLES